MLKTFPDNIRGPTKFQFGLHLLKPVDENVVKSIQLLSQKCGIEYLRILILNLVRHELLHILLSYLLLLLGAQDIFAA